VGQPLQGKKVAILVDNGFEQVELTGPKQALEAAGAQTVIVSPQQTTVRGWDMTDWGREFSVDVPLDRAAAEEFDALLLPGGVMNPDHLRTNEEACQFVRDMMDDGKPVAAICHGPWTLVDAGRIDGRRMTSYPSIKMDLIHAGAQWVDEPVVIDEGLITSRSPDDLPQFNRAILEEFAKGPRETAT
jgi:protease I